jgi:hypothetical protein
MLEKEDQHKSHKWHIVFQDKTGAQETRFAWGDNNIHEAIHAVLRADSKMLRMSNVVSATKVFNRM